MRAFKELASRLLKKEQLDDKKSEAFQAWRVLNVLSQKTELKGDFRKIDKSKLPEELKDWPHYDDISGDFKIDLLKIDEELFLKITSGGHYFKLGIKNKYDTNPVVAEGREDFATEVPAGLKESPIKFALHLSKFVYHHWRQANPQAVQDGEV